MEWEDFDPEWLAKLAEEQFPEEAWLPAALRKCVKHFKESKAYFYFVSPDNVNQPGSLWQFRRNIILHDKKEGDLVIDILKDNRIGGIEFLSRL